MEKNSIVVGVLLLIVGIGVGYMLRGNNTITSKGHMMSDGSMMAQNIDQHFIAEMIPHHEGAIEMAKVALTRSKRPEIVSLATAIIEAQQKEINNTREWHQSWYSSLPLDGSMGMMHMDGMTGDLGELTSKSETEFDRAFILQMIHHHEMAVMMAQMLQASTQREEMKQLASNIITSQTSEIEMMRGWLKSWYPTR